MKEQVLKRGKENHLHMLFFCKENIIIFNCTYPYLMDNTIFWIKIWPIFSTCVYTPEKNMSEQFRSFIDEVTTRGQLLLLLHFYTYTRFTCVLWPYEIKISTKINRIWLFCIVGFFFFLVQILFPVDFTCLKRNE